MSSFASSLPFSVPSQIMICDLITLVNSLFIGFHKVKVTEIPFLFPFSMNLSLTFSLDQDKVMLYAEVGKTYKQNGPSIWSCG